VTLRTRLLLALFGSGLALLLGGFVAREIAIRYASEASIQSSLEARLGALDRETCEAGMDIMNREFRPRPDGSRPRPGPPRPLDREPRMRPRPGGGGFGPASEGPRERGGPPGGPRVTRVYFYDPEFNPRPPGGPPFPESAKARLRVGDASANGREEEGFFGAVATPWPGGACNYALAILPAPPPLARFTSLIMSALLLIGTPAIALWFALTKPVARLRALAADVRGAAFRHYETSVPVQGQDEIAELGHAFNEASAVVRAHLAEVERREKAVRDFVAHTTHDVALPLSVLLSHVTTLRQTARPG
jgi:HAMP domain-containing protein